ncbi:MAG: hypothetical protein BV456_09825, partial [Thermoplasmata archaeon M8B2D]
IGNVILFFIKISLGFFINSIALIADGIHSLSDVSTSGIVIFGFRIAKKDPDKEHPFGHGRAEYIATLIIAILLIIVGLGFIQQSIGRIISLEQITHQEYLITIGIVVLISAVFKELMAKYSFAISKKINSDVLKADAWHHRSDALSSIGVAIGIIAARFGFPILDPVFAILVSIIIIYVGIDLMKKSSNFLMGTKIDNDMICQIEEIVKSIEHAKGLHDIFLHDYGTNKVLTLHVEIDSNLSIEKAHKIADILEKEIQARTNFSTVIHLEPINNKLNNKEEIEFIKKILESQKEVVSFHKIQIINTSDNDLIKMHLVVNHSMPVEKTHKLCNIIEKILLNKYGPCKVDIHFDPCYKNCKICNISCKNFNKYNNIK